MIAELVKVRFLGIPKAYSLVTNGCKYHHGQKVIAQNEHGTSIGIINSFPYQKVIEENCFQNVIRIADKNDLIEEKKQNQKLIELKPQIIKIVKKLELKMTISHLVPVDGMTKIVVFYTADERVDFRQLLIDLSLLLKVRVEMCWITKQEKEQAFAAKGACGHVTSFFNEGSLRLHRFSKKSKNKA